MRPLSESAATTTKLLVEKGTDGRSSALIFRDLPEPPYATALIVSWRRTKVQLPFAKGWLRVDPFAPGAAVLPLDRFPLREQSLDLGDKELLVQGLVVDRSGWKLCNALTLRVVGAGTRSLRELEIPVDGAREFPAFRPDGRIRILAHKAQFGDMPENSLESLRAAFAAGVDHVEMDLRFSKDRVPILLHDWTVDRTTDGKGFAEALTYEQLHALDASKGSPGQSSAVRIPRLRDAILAAKGPGRILLDVKESNAADDIRKELEGLEDPGSKIWLFVDRSLNALIDLNRKLPAIPLIYGSVPDDLSEASLHKLRALGVVGFDLQWGSFDKSFVDAAHDAGLFVFSFTINEAETFREARELGVDGVETDRPDLLLAAREADAGPPTLPLLALVLSVFLLLALEYLSRKRRSIVRDSTAAPGDPS